MARKKKEDKPAINAFDSKEVDLVIEHHSENLDNNPQFSLDVDPLGQYHMTDEHKQIIRMYCDTMNPLLVQTVLGISTEDYNAVMSMYSSQEEIRRIMKAKYQRRFATKMLDLNAIGGYLTTMITDEYVPTNERLNSKDKLSAVSMLIELNKLKAEALINPQVVNYGEVEDAAKKMTTTAIKNLLASTKKPNNEKNDLVSVINSKSNNTLLPEEIDYLKSLSTVELMKLLNSLSK